MRRKTCHPAANADREPNAVKVDIHKLLSKWNDVGYVEPHGRGYRARLFFRGRRLRGSVRENIKTAEADLIDMRRCSFPDLSREIAAFQTANGVVFIASFNV